MLRRRSWFWYFDGFNITAFLWLKRFWCKRSSRFGLLNLITRLCFLGCLAASKSKPMYRVDIPIHDWPTAQFPQLKYPLVEHEIENRENENRALETVWFISVFWSVSLVSTAAVFDLLQNNNVTMFCGCKNFKHRLCIFVKKLIFICFFLLGFYFRFVNRFWIAAIVESLLQLV